MSRKARVKGKGDKGRTMFRHAADRAASRYGLELTVTLHGSIVRKIATGVSTQVERQSLRVSVHDVPLDDGLVVRVVYDRDRRALVTFLPAPDGAPVRRPSP